MKFLIQTHQGYFLVEGKDYNAACHNARLSSCVDVDKGIQMLGGFANPVRYAEKLMHTGIVLVSPDLLKIAIDRFAAAHVERSWMGSKDIESHAEIEKDLDEACDLLKELTGLYFDSYKPCSNTSATPPSSTPI